MEPVRVPVADATHAEGELLLDLDLRLALDRVVETTAGPACISRRPGSHSMS